MATRPVVTSRVMNRKSLAGFLKTPEQIRAFEALAGDISKAIPDAVYEASASAEAAQATADKALEFAEEIDMVALVNLLIVKVRGLEARVQEIEDSP